MYGGPIKGVSYIVYIYINVYLNLNYVYIYLIYVYKYCISQSSEEKDIQITPGCQWFSGCNLDKTIFFSVGLIPKQNDQKWYGHWLIC